ncbi:MAG: hypothetical protein ACFFD2_30760 [Promethearchaeota archaeon]
MVSKAGNILMIVGGAVGLLLSIMGRIVIISVIIPGSSPSLGLSFAYQLVTLSFWGIIFGIAVLTCGILGLSIKGTTSRVLGGVALGLSTFFIIYLLISMVQGMAILTGGDIVFQMISTINHLLGLACFAVALVGGILALASSSEF